MTFEEAKIALAKLAGKESYAISYELMITQIYGDGRDIIPACGVYIKGQKWHQAKTWEAVLKEMSDAMGVTEADASEAPTGELATILANCMPIDAIVCEKERGCGYIAGPDIGVGDGKCPKCGGRLVQWGTRMQSM